MNVIFKWSGTPALTSWARGRHVGRGTADMTDATNARKSLTWAKTAPASPSTMAWVV